MSDPIIETPPPIEVEVITGAATPLSADTPEDLGTAAAGVSMEASRSDHVHAMPSAADVGADPAGAASAVAGDLSAHESLTTTAHGGIVGDTDARLTDARIPLAHTHGQSDVTNLTADLAGKAPTSRLITAGTGLSGGGDLSADRSLTVVYGTGAGTSAQGNDARLSDARTPLAHAVSHQDGGTDELALDGSQIQTGTVAPGRLPGITPTAYTGSSAPWVATAEGTATGNGGLNVAYRMIFLPILLGARTWDRIGVTTTVAGAGTSWELGVYDLLPSGEPGAQIASFATLDMSVTAGDQDLPISFTPTTTRWFYIGIKVTAFGSAPTVRVAGATGPAPRLPGWPHRRNGDTFSGLAVVGGLTAGPLPAVAPTVGNAAGQAAYAPSSPIVYMRHA